MNGNGSSRRPGETARLALYAGVNLLAAVLVLVGSLAVAGFIAGALYAFVRFFFLEGSQLISP